MSASVAFATLMVLTGTGGNPHVVHDIDTPETNDPASHDPPAPDPHRGCYLVLNKYCSAERSSNHSLCIKCATLHQRELDSANCSYTQVEDFCSIPPAPHPSPPGPPPPPLPAQCENALRRDCGQSRTPVGDCEMCVATHEVQLRKDGCSETQLNEFCHPTPGPTPSCTKEFTAVCGHERKNHTICLRCASEHNGTLQKSGCTHAAVSELCHVPEPPHPHPPPSPPSPSPEPGKCYKTLYEACENVRADKEACVKCGRAHASHLVCSSTEIDNFCHVSPPPPRPPTPPPSPAPMQKCKAAMDNQCGNVKGGGGICMACFDEPTKHKIVIAAGCDFEDLAAFCKPDVQCLTSALCKAGVTCRLNTYCESHSVIQPGGHCELRCPSGALKLVGCGTNAMWNGTYASLCDESRIYQ